MFIKQCHIDAYTIYELSKILFLTSITDVCLDGSPLHEGNYEILLNSDCRLNHISLSRCLINDEVCSHIASKLYYLGSAEATLMTLNLSSNSITDVGAKLLADALRTNRRLRYLNLAGNHITDDGAYSLFESLMEFPLSHDEILNRNLRYMDYLKTKQALLMKYLNEWDSISVNEYSQVSKKSVPKKKKSSATSLKSKQPIGQEKPILQNVTDDSMFLKAEMLAGEVMGPFVDPFSTSYINKKDNYYTYCVGNLVLCCLNLSYNNLTFLCLRKLYSVLLHQDSHKKLNQPGLIKVLLDGNYMPNECTEIFQINEIISKNIRSYKERLYGEVGARRKSRMSKISVLSGTPHTSR